MSASEAFADIGYHAEGTEDVSFGVVPGSRGTAGTLATPWAPRRSPATDRARAEAMAVIRTTLRARGEAAGAGQSTTRRRVSAAEYHAARERVMQGRGW